MLPDGLVAANGLLIWAITHHIHVYWWLLMTVWPCHDYYRVMVVLREGFEYLSGEEDNIGRNSEIRGTAWSTTRLLRRGGIEGKIQEIDFVRSTNGENNDVGRTFVWYV